MSFVGYVGSVISLSSVSPMGFVSSVESVGYVGSVSSVGFGDSVNFSSPIFWSWSDAARASSRIWACTAGKAI